MPQSVALDAIAQWARGGSSADLACLTRYTERIALVNHDGGSS